MKKIYFAHPITLYHTDLELKLIRDIDNKFPLHQTINPAEKVHQEGYIRYKKESGNGMDYFFKKLLLDSEINSGVCLPFEDGMFGAGVYSEAEFLFKRGCELWEIDYSGGISEMVLDPYRRLSVDETRRRVRN